MANPQHLEILKKGVEVWNRWRQEDTGTAPDLSSADLTDANLPLANLNLTDLGKAILRRANLANAAILSADLNGATISEACLTCADLSMSKLRGSDLRGAYLDGANLLSADFTGADLKGADLEGAILNWASISGADISDVNLTSAEIHRADLSNSNFRNTDLRWTRITNSLLDGAEFQNANFGYTILCDVDLRATKGLEMAQHEGPSSIGIDTIYKSQGKIPEEFLQNAGVPQEVIEIAHSIRNGPPTQWQSCLISYSHKDENFARRLHGRMRKAGMRVWYAPEDMKGGKKLHEQLFDAIQYQDRLLLVLSDQSIRSEWVMTEIRKAREVERKQNRRKLFPIRLVNMETLQAWTCFDADSGKDLAVEVREYFIPDFSNWKDHDSFESAFAKLQTDLKTDKPKP